MAAAGAALTRRLAAEPDLAQVVSYWATGAPALKSCDGGQALVIGRITGDEQDLDTRAAVLDAAYARDDPTLRVQVGGQAQVFREVGEQVEADLARAEAIAVPITLVLLVLVFASAVAGALPLAVGGFAIAGAPVVLPALLAVLGRRVDRFRLTLGRRLQGPLAAAGDAAVPPQARRFAAADGTWLSVVPSVEPSAAAGEDLVAAVRDLPAPLGARVAGPSARLVDTKASLFGHLPAAAAVIALVTFVLLFLMTGSVVIPLKALVLNLLSLTAVYGAMVYVFQDGHLAGLLGFTPTGTIDTSMPVLLFCIAFGLSMDYEVFLLSRIKEEHDRTGDTVAAVAVGLERTGRIVTTAAALLVPAFMRLAGRANWWAPAPLRRLHARFGLAEAPGASGA